MDDEIDAPAALAAIEAGGDVDAICPMRVPAGSGRSRGGGALDGLARGLRSGRPNLAKALVAGVVVLPLAPIIGLFDALGSLFRGSGRKTVCIDSTALHLAARAGSLEVTTALLAAGAAPNALDSREQPPLYFALERALLNGDAALCALLLDHGAEIDRLGTLGADTVFVLAGHLDLFALLVEHGLDPDSREQLSDPTALLLAVDEGDDALALTVLAHGADPELGDDEGPPVLRAALREDAEMLDRLIALGAHVDAGCDSATPLLDAVEEGHHGAAELLLDRGADVHHCDGLQQTALHRAVQENDLPMIELLVARGADIHARDRFEFTPLFDSVARLQGPTTARLIELGAEIDDPVVEWALKHADGSGKAGAAPEEVLPEIQVLVEAGMPVSMDLLEGAARAGSSDHIEVLIAHEDTLRPPAWGRLKRYAKRKGATDEIVQQLDDERRLRRTSAR